MKRAILAIITILLIILACSKKKDPPVTVDCNAVPKSFSSNVSPITSTRCALSGCHEAGSVNGPGPLTSYQQIFSARVNIRSAVTSGLMPQGSTLTQAQINTIVCWIDSGAPNN